MEVLITEKNFEEEVLKSDIPVLVDFWAVWCGPCKMIADEVKAVAEKFDGKIKVGKINVDEELGLAIRYRVESIPTLIYFDKGEIKNKSLGFLTANEIEKYFNL